MQLDKVQDQVEKLYKLVKSQPQISKTHMQSIKSLYAEVVRGLGKDAPQPPPKVGSRTRRPSSQFLRPAAVQEATFLPEDKVPLLHLKRKIGNEWQYSSKLTYAICSSRDTIQPIDPSPALPARSTSTFSRRSPPRVSRSSTRTPS